MISTQYSNVSLIVGKTPSSSITQKSNLTSSSVATQTFLSSNTISTGSATFEYSSQKINLPTYNKTSLLTEQESTFEETAGTKKVTNLWSQGLDTDEKYFSSLAQFLGIDKQETEEIGASSELQKSQNSSDSKSDFLNKLRKSIKSDSKQLQAEINTVLKNANVKLGRHDRVRFQLDAEGNLIIDGIKNTKLQAKTLVTLEKRPELLDAMKTLAARQQVYNAVDGGKLETVMQESPGLRRLLANNYLNTTKELSLDNFRLVEDAEGQRTLTSTLMFTALTGGKTLNETQMAEHESHMGLIGGISGLDVEIAELLAGPPVPKQLGKETARTLQLVEYQSGNDTVKVDFSYKNGVLMNDTIYDQERVDKMMHSLATFKLKRGCTPDGTPEPENEWLRNFTVIVRADGSFRIDEVNLGIDGPKSEEILKKKAQAEFEAIQPTAQESVDDILLKHQYDYGDVFPEVDENSHLHEVKLRMGVGGKNSGYDILSPGAEEAAEENLAQAKAEFNNAFGQYLKNMLKENGVVATDLEVNGMLQNMPIGFALDKKNGDLLVDVSSITNSKYADLLEMTFEQLKIRINSDDPLADEKFEEPIESEHAQAMLNSMIDIKHHLYHLMQKQKKNEQMAMKLNISNHER